MHQDAHEQTQVDNTLSKQEQVISPDEATLCQNFIQ